MPRRSVAVDGMIWARPVAERGVPSAITVGRPALSRNTIASSTSGSTVIVRRSLDLLAPVRGALGRERDATLFA